MVHPMQERAMSTRIYQPGSPTLPSGMPVSPVAADPMAVAAFNARMAPASADAPARLATDAQLAEIPKGDLDRLRAKWGTDEAGFREEAHGLWEFGQNFQNAIMTQLLNDAFKRMQERAAEERR
jgi:hypothetical protein